MDIKIVSAGVDPNHQIGNCDYCDKDITEDEAIPTCDQAGPVTLCRKCYNEAGNSVR